MSKRSTRGNIIELGGEPRINFLPGEIQQRKDARRRRRSLFMLVILVGILCGIGYVYSAQYATERQAALEAEQQTTLDLLAQQGQFAEARSLADQVRITGEAISYASHNSVFWALLLADMVDALPEGAVLHQWTAKGLSSLEVVEPTESLFPVSGVAQLDLDVRTVDLMTLRTAMQNLAERPGVLSVEIGSVSQVEGEIWYGSIITVRFGEDALMARYSEGWVPGPFTLPDELLPYINQGPEQPANDENRPDGEDEPVEEGEQ